MTGGGRSRSSWIALAIAAGVVAGLVAFAAVVWAEIGDAGISTGGWIALVFGILATLGLGIGLMALMFISSRRGYDDGPQR